MKKLWGKLITQQLVGMVKLINVRLNIISEI